MKLLKYINHPRTFSDMVRRALDEASGYTSLQLRHKLKENWSDWVDLIKDHNVYNNVNEIIFKKYYNDIESISNIKPSTIEVPDFSIKDNIEDVYNDITTLMGEHKSLTVNALLWATLCHSGTKLRLKDFIKINS
jgi:hypothetical protein